VLFANELQKPFVIYKTNIHGTIFIYAIILLYSIY